ncbi:MAG: transposase [Desulfurella sp.]
MSGLEEKIISMYTMGLSTRNIQDQIKELYSFDVSCKFISDCSRFSP